MKKEVFQANFYIAIMKKIFSLLLLLLPLLVLAQSTQQVMVLEYNGKEQKTPLEGVSISVQNAASALSDAQGQLTLQFRTLKAGDAVQLRRIDLAGYEVFNQEAVDAWTISPAKSFSLILCRSDRFKNLCEQYNAAASASYERQLKKDKVALEKLRKEGKLKQQEYESQLAAIEQLYYEQLDNLENYVERFARIDLSEISAEEQKIIELVQQGEIEEAIRLYEEMDLLGKYKKQSEEILSVRQTHIELQQIKNQKEEARDSLANVLRQQIELYEQQGNQLKADSLRQSLQLNNDFLR